MRSGDANLHRRLVWRLLPALFVAIAITGVTSYFVARRSADVAYDLALVAAAADIAGGVDVEGGRAAFNLSVQSERILRSDARDNIYFAVRLADGAFLAGDRDLREAPLGDDNGNAGTDATSFDLAFRGETLRAMSTRFTRDSVLFVVTVAETTRKRRTAAWTVFAQLALPTTLVLLLAGLIVWHSVRGGLQPLDDLQTEIEGKSEVDLSPIATVGAPFEVRALVHALNHLLARLDTATRTHQSFVADAAHQLRTPLAGIQTQVELLSASADPSQQAALATLGFSVTRAIRLVNQLLALARSDRDANALHLQTFDLAALIGLAADDWVHRAIQARIDLGFDLHPATLQGDPYLIRELLDNIVDNALLHVPAGGAVTVATARSGDRIELTVDDSGPGIAPASRERVFERFHRESHGDGLGTGLGLAIVRQIVGRHGGWVEAQTAPTLGGLRMLVRLPVEQAARGNPPKTVAARTARSDSRVPIEPEHTS